MTAPSPAAAGLPDEDVERVARAMREADLLDEHGDMLCGHGAASSEAHRRCRAAAALAEMQPTANRRAAEELEAAARGVMAGATEVAGLPVAVRQVLTIAATVISARAAALAPVSHDADGGERR